MISRDPFSIKECNIGSGAACGSVYLDKGFERLVQEKFGNKASSILTPKRLNGALRHFEVVVKRVFDPYDGNCQREYEIPLIGAPDVPESGLVDCYLTLSQYHPPRILLSESMLMDRDEIQAVFDPIFLEILGLVHQQIRDVEIKQNASLKV